MLNSVPSLILKIVAVVTKFYIYEIIGEFVAQLLFVIKHFIVLIIATW